jgi:hypothetical protein
MNESPVQFDTAIYCRGGGRVCGESASDGMQTESQRLTYQIVQLRGPGFTPQLSERRSVLPSGEACNWIVQLRGPGFTPQLSERRSVLRPLEKPATGSCNCVAPDSLNCQRDEALIAFWRSLRLECKQKGEKKK